MKTKEIQNFGNTYLLSGDEIDKFETLSVIFEEEENFVLSLKREFDLEVREDLLILFVQMYLLRFAIPHFQLTQNKFPDRKDASSLRKVLYFCLAGRFIDDLVDADSKMFRTYESILLFQKYYARLANILPETEKTKFDAYLFTSTKYKSPVPDEELNFNCIRDDVYQRIRYFFCEAERSEPLKQLQLQTYMGILLGGLDVNDAIADGYQQKSSTAISNFIYQQFYNDEGKLLLDQKLLNFYASINRVLAQEVGKLADYCYTHHLDYTANILKRIQH